MASSSGSADQSSGRPSSSDDNSNIRVSYQNPGERNPAVKSGAVLLKYNFFKLDPVEEEKVRCIVCSRQFAYKDGGTSGMRKHLASQHADENKLYLGILEQGKSKEKQLTQTKLQSNPSKQLTLQFIDPKIQERFNKATVMFVAEKHLTFQQAEGLSVVVEALFPKGQSKVKPLSRKQIAALTKTFYDEMRGDLSKIFEYLSKHCRCFAFTADLWSSPSMESFIGFSLHCIDKDFNMVTFIPFVQVFKEVHKGTFIKIKLEEFVKVSFFISADQNSGQLFRGNIS